MGESIFEVERVSEEEVIMRLKTKKLRLLPTASREHVRAAGRELLLALRSLVDIGIESLEQREETKRKKKTRIEVE